MTKTDQEFIAALADRCFVRDYDERDHAALPEAARQLIAVLHRMMGSAKGLGSMTIAEFATLVLDDDSVVHFNADGTMRGEG